ncbi:MAG TPA: G1 family glutamic endopeptidase [Streptosporangiaceae bacterium]|nr:G1 family glutamic endopeptidase [Streptosporangiaceae bacterium]
MIVNGAGQPPDQLKGVLDMRKVRTIITASVTALAVPALAVTAAASALTTAHASTKAHASTTSFVSTATRAAPAGPKPVVRVQGMHVIHVQLPRTHLPHLIPHDVVRSSNWSGYAAVARPGVRLRFVQANFTIPSVNCANSPLGTLGFAYASNWVGLDGFHNMTVEQAGVDSFCDSTGVPQYAAWYEMFPLAPVAFGPVSPGDAISASVFYSSSTNRNSITLTDLTSGAKMQATNLRCPAGSTCRHTSAEVITEDPGNSVPQINLADYGMVNVTGAAVTSADGTKGTLNANSRWTSSQIIMRNSNTKTVMSQPSGLFGGKAFNVTWKAAK